MLRLFFFPFGDRILETRGFCSSPLTGRGVSLVRSLSLRTVTFQISLHMSGLKTRLPPFSSSNVLLPLPPHCLSGSGSGLPPAECPPPFMRGVIQIALLPFLQTAYHQFLKFHGPFRKAYFLSHSLFLFVDESWVAWSLPSPLCFVTAGINRMSPCSVSGCVLPLSHAFPSGRRPPAHTLAVLPFYQSNRKFFSPFNPSSVEEMVSSAPANPFL